MFDYADIMKWDGASQNKVIPVGTTGELLGPSEKRVGVIISVTGGTLILNTRTPANADDGLPIAAGAGSVVYLFQFYIGNLVKRSLFGFASVGDCHVGLIEIVST